MHLFYNGGMTQKIRTSLTHPLQINTLNITATSRLGLSFCPGKKQSQAMTGAWARDLDIDLDAICNWGAAAVVTILEDAELPALGVPNLGDAVKARGMAWVQLPLPNDAVPDAAFMERWAQARPYLHSVINNMGNLYIHCMGGIGRTSMVAGMLLMDYGATADEAVARVRDAREGSFCVEEQIEFLRDAYKPLSPAKGRAAAQPAFKA